MNSPKIRFKGFADDWEQRKLGEIVDRITRKNQDLVSTLPLTISAQYGLIDQNEFFDKRVASKDVSGYYLVNKGEFAYNKSTSSDAPWGAIKRLDRYENGVLSTLYIVFAIKENAEVDSDYLVTYYETDLWHRGIREIAAEGARNHGLLNIAPADFFETSLAIPQDVEEQKTIGRYFSQLNTLITLHQCKCEEVKKLKKCMLQKMFPRDGMNVPEIRFDGFTDAWEQRKVSDIGEIITGNTPPTKDKDNYGGEYLFVSPADIQGNRYANKTVTTLTEKGFKLGRMLKPGATLFVSIGSTIGKVAQTKDFATTNQQINAVVPNDDLDNDFVFTLFENISPKIKSLSAQQAVPIVNKTTFSEAEVFVPPYEEQKIIGKYFENLDNLITLHQRKYEELQKLKKFMLQTMFV